MTSRSQYPISNRNDHTVLTQPLARRLLRIDLLSIVKSSITNDGLPARVNEILGDYRVWNKASKLYDRYDIH